ncbi:LOW QUALITY PROTEIN: circadian-associated transcriptional repressor [Gastrophryne carolinensis]
MEDTESSDFLSSSGSLFSSFSTGSTSSAQEDPNNSGFNASLSDGFTDATGAKEGIRMIPNSRLSSADHPVLIRLENEYQTQRALWYRRMGQYCYAQETAGRTSCPGKNKLLGGTPLLGDGYRDRPIVDLAFSDGPNLEAPQGLKRQRNPNDQYPPSWWSERKEPGLPLSDGDRIFAQKCRDLQGFIKPLTDLLNGLKRGRYDRGLSSFQQSLAMDRIQRIVGVLQKPEIGERYLSTLLQVEMMLKVWFPGVTSASSSSSFSSSSELDMEEPQNKVAKYPDVGSIEPQNYQTRPQHCPSRPTINRPARSPAASVPTDCICCKDGVQVLAEWPAVNLTWMHTSPISNPSLSQADVHHLNSVFGQDLFGPNGSSCGIIFLVQNSQVSATPAAVSMASEVDEASVQYPSRSQSAPPKIVITDHPNPRKIKNHSHSHPYLSACRLTSVGENT